MLRRPPTTLSITAEDVADYEDRRNAERVAYVKKINDAIARHQPPEPQWAPSHTSLDSDSDDHYREDDDESQDISVGGFDGGGDGNSTMDLDASPLNGLGGGRGGGLGRGMGVRGGLGGGLGGDGAGGGFSSPAAARAVGRGGRGGRGGLGARQAGGATATQALGRGQGQGQGPAGGAGQGAGPVVTPETRPTRSREERIGVAPERRRR